MAYETFNWPTQIGSKGSTTYNTSQNEFDGYIQIVGTGINNRKRTWQLTFIGDSDDVPLVKAFFDKHAGVEPFLWQIPSSTGKILVTTKGFENSYVGMDVEDLNFTFTEFLSPRIQR
jgi:phage-related protein